MRTAQFAGTEVPVVGQGTWFMERVERKTAVAALQRGLDLGLTHIDTAEMYGSGQAETVVAEAIAGRRPSVFLVSKVLPSNASRKGTVQACEASLKRLGTDYLDCYLLHWRGSVPLEETVAAFESLKRAGKIRAWGVSNFDVEDLDDMQAVAGAGAMACNQVLYHLRERAIEHAVIPWCAANGLAVVAYSPFGHDDFPDEGRQGDILTSIAQAYGATPRQIALAFLTQRAGVLAIPKAARPAHVAENAGGARIELAPDDIAQLDRAFPRGPRGRGLPML